MHDHDLNGPIARRRDSWLCGGGQRRTRRSEHSLRHFVCESGEAATEANARDLIRGRLGELLGDGVAVQVSKIGRTIFVVRSFEDKNNGPSPEASVLRDYYSAQIAGAE